MNFEELAKILVEEHGWTYKVCKYGYELKKGEEINYWEDGELSIETDNYSFTLGLSTAELKLIAKYKESLEKEKEAK